MKNTELIHLYRNKPRIVGLDDDQNTICMNGSAHTIKTNDKKDVTCHKCIEIMGPEIMDKEIRKTIIKLQATLIKIEMKSPVFFNITQYKKLGLIKEYGKTLDNKVNWILTQKAKQYLNVVI